MSAGFVLGEGEAKPLGLLGCLRRTKCGGDLFRRELGYLARLHGGDHLAHRVSDGAAMRASRRGHDRAPK